MPYRLGSIGQQDQTFVLILRDTDGGGRPTFARLDAHGRWVAGEGATPVLTDVGQCGDRMLHGVVHLFTLWPSISLPPDADRAVLSYRGGRVESFPDVAAAEEGFAKAGDHL